MTFLPGKFVVLNAGMNRSLEQFSLRWRSTTHFEIPVKQVEILFETVVSSGRKDR